MTALEQLQQGLPFRRELRKLVLNILGNANDVEDVLQEVHTAAWLAASVGDEPTNLRKFLTTMARNRAVDLLRRQRREQGTKLDPQMVGAPENRGSVEVALQAMTERQAEVAESLIETGSVTETAAKLGMTERAVRNVAERAVEVLRGGEG